ncbi:winged helix-turn-helix transcriptional regulator [Salsipaludibacter albus]|uniref:winged helix-turn-helix transcriptional regulator n=1 Tax=Salsipaludibacter albus TaxID=2849650 RepID=UPI001EE425A9|nr:winged helix-turn-helix transcriptional regulator [Salsipaludibacter albus]MBY5162569.1 winged helix-turn-helix transcriptional regulator [Salsipaludibacter albus]
MPTTYGQFCPVAKAMELLDERWTVLVVRELMLGSRHFNAIRRGVPHMSPTLLSKRLRTLVKAGVVERWEDGNRVVYRLSEAGRELEPIIESLGVWGTRWIPELGDADLDPHLLMWDVHRRIDLAEVPDSRTVVRFRFPEVPGAPGTWWVVIDEGEVDLCDVDPGHDVLVTVRSSLRTMTLLWRGDLDWPTALRTGQLQLDGPAHAVRAVPRWLKLSTFAPVPRPGPERDTTLLTVRA